MQVGLLPTDLLGLLVLYDYLYPTCLPSTLLDTTLYHLLLPATCGPGGTTTCLPSSFGHLPPYWPYYSPSPYPSL